MAKIPVSRDDLVKQLKKMGYKDIEVGAKSRKVIAVFLDITKDIRKTRVNNLQTIASGLSSANIIARYDTSVDAGSTVGQVVVKSTEAYGDGELIVYVKAKGKTGDARPGVANEIYLKDTISKYVEMAEGPITVKFSGGGSTMTISGVTGADRIGDVGGAKIGRAHV